MPGPVNEMLGQCHEIVMLLNPLPAYWTMSVMSHRPRSREGSILGPADRLSIVSAVAAASPDGGVIVSLDVAGGRFSKPVPRESMHRAVAAGGIYQAVLRLTHDLRTRQPASGRVLIGQGGAAACNTLLWRAIDVLPTPVTAGTPPVITMSRRNDSVPYAAALRASLRKA